MPNSSLFWVSEIFSSIQGEGSYLGTPAIFLRFAGCNLSCCWDGEPCDSRYAVTGEDAVSLDLDSLLEQTLAQRQKFPGIRQVILTGGEPLLQPLLPELTTRLREHDFFIALETNGTRAVKLSADFISLSPKLGSAFPADTDPAILQQRRQPQVLRFWMNRHDFQLKFTWGSEKDETEILELLTDLGSVPPEKICLMPVGITREALRQRGRRCVEICLRHGWRYSPRAHIELYDAARGV